MVLNFNFPHDCYESTKLAKELMYNGTSYWMMKIGFFVNLTFFTAFTVAVTKGVLFI